MRLHWTACLLLGMLLSCRTVKPLESSSLLASNSSLKVQEVIALCFATQGNGNYFAATLGWLAESIDQRAKEAEAREILSGQRVGLTLNCAGGASSGSFAILVLSRLLQNQKLRETPINEEIITPRDAKQIAAGIRYVALSSDVNAYEFAVGAGQAIQQYIGGQIERIPYPYKKSNTVQWWTDQVLNPDLMVIHFSSMLLLADQLDASHLREGWIDSRFNTEEKKLLIGLQSTAISDLQNLDQHPLEADPSFRVHRSIASKQAATIGRSSETLVTSLFSLGAYKGRFFNGLYEKAHPLFRNILEAPPQDGMCSFMFGAMVANESSVPLTLPPFLSLHPVAGCNAGTLKDMRSHAQKNPNLGQGLQETYWGEVKNNRALMALSIREPRLMPETYGPIQNPPIEIRQLMTTSSSDDLAAASPWFLDLGGFVDRRTIAGRLNGYFRAKVASLQDRGIRVWPHWELFGKPDEAGSYGLRVLQNLFSKDAVEYQSFLASWENDLKNSCAQLQEPIGSTAVDVTTTAFNWDSVGRLPPLNWTDIYVARAANARRLQIAGYSGPWAFDPAYWRVPLTPTQPTGCGY